MSHEKHVPNRRLALLLASTLCAAAGTPAFAADSALLAANDLPAPATLPTPATLPAPLDPPPASPSSASPAAPSQNVTINLINRLVQRGVLTKEDAAELIKQAEADAETARASAQAQAQAAAGPAPSEDAVHVTYVPELVKEQMRDEIEAQVIKQAREENWAAPRTFPDWVSRFKLIGDFRFRYEAFSYPNGNDATGSFVNYNAINTGNPFDTSLISNPNHPPTYNVDQDRQRLRIRARFGAEVDLGDGFTSGIRFATGDSNTPVSENQTLGANGGNFSKYSLWLDRAFLKYELGGRPSEDFTLTVGRFDNPFFATSIIWADDLAFDGVAAQGRYSVRENLTPFFTAGVFPIFNTDLNFGTNQPAKFPSNDKWLEAAQVGTEWKINQDFTAKFAVAYYHFQNISGRLSDPFFPQTASDIADTDATRPGFAQQGNTYMELRNIQPDAFNNFGTTNLYQYFGLATPFRELAFTGRIDYSHFDPFHVALISEVVKNLAFNEADINSRAINNRSQDKQNGAALGDFAGGDTAWILSLKLGSIALQNRWDWNVIVGYRYVESDAVVDGFCDSDFGGGGTNLKGFTLAGAVALSPRVSLGLRWFSADQIAGPQYKSDIIQFDINAKF